MGPATGYYSLLRSALKARVYWAKRIFRRRALNACVLPKTIKIDLKSLRKSLRVDILHKSPKSSWKESVKGRLKHGPLGDFVLSFRPLDSWRFLGYSGANRW